MKSAAPDDPTNSGHVTRVASIADIEALALTTEKVLVLRLDDEKARALTRLPQLRTLYHDGSSKLTDVGLAALASLDSLRSLDLEWCTQITDDGLATLHRLIDLEWLDIGFCSALTKTGVSKLRQALPGGCPVLR